jgi:hypothetical protein
MNSPANLKSSIDFSKLTFDDFKDLAKNSELSRHEKVGFPDEYRNGKEEEIFVDIKNKLTNLNCTNKTILEIGPGCSKLPLLLSNLCVDNCSSLIFVDSSEMLEHLPNGPHISKFNGAFPEAFSSEFNKYVNKIDVLIAYSVIQYVFTGGNLWDFIDRCLMLLSVGGEILLGDIPNNSMRKRFFSSEAGLISHRQYTGSDVKPEVIFNNLEIGQMDDSVVLGIIARARSQGFHAWVLPQSTLLPMGNRREDILIRKP